MASQNWVGGKGKATRWGCRIKQNWLQEPIEGTVVNPSDSLRLISLFPSEVCPIVFIGIGLLAEIMQGGWWKFWGWMKFQISMCKIAPPNGSCAQDAAGIAVAHQCRHLLKCFALCPRWAPAASFAWFCIFSVLLYLFLHLLRRHGVTALSKSVMEQLCRRQHLGPPLKNDFKTTQIGGWGHLMVQITLSNQFFPYELLMTSLPCSQRASADTGAAALLLFDSLLFLSLRCCLMREQSLQQKRWETTRARREWDFRIWLKDYFLESRLKSGYSPGNATSYPAFHYVLLHNNTNQKHSHSAFFLRPFLLWGILPLVSSTSRRWNAYYWQHYVVFVSGANKHTLGRPKAS